MLIVTLRRLAVAIGLLLTATVLAGCAQMFGVTSAGAGASPAPSATADAVASPAACVNLVAGEGYDEPTTLDDFHRLSAAAIVGNFGAVGKAHWNTPDEARPANVSESAAMPVRPLAISSSEVVAGTPNASRVVLVGGTVGCDTVSIASADSIELVEGQKYLFIVFQIDDSTGKPSGDWSLLAAWPVGDKGLVATSADGDLTVGEIQMGLQAGRPEVTPPNLPEPSGPG